MMQAMKSGWIAGSSTNLPPGVDAPDIRPALTALFDFPQRPHEADAEAGCDEEEENCHCVGQNHFNSLTRAAKGRGRSADEDVRRCRDAIGPMFVAAGCADPPSACGNREIRCSLIRLIGSSTACSNSTGWICP